MNSYPFYYFRVQREFRERARERERCVFRVQREPSVFFVGVRKL